MKRDVKVYLTDIIESIKLIEDYMRTVTKEGFFKDSKLQDAVMRRLEIIGEATKNVPNDFREKYPYIEWKKVAGMRDILTHVYFGMNLERIWIVVKENLPELKKKILKIIREKEDES